VGTGEIILGIYPMAALTLIISSLIWGGLVFLISGRSKRYLWAIALGIPLSPPINILVKGPLAYLVAGVLGLKPVFTSSQPVWFLAFLFMLAPALEEAVKPLPLALRKIRINIRDPSSALSIGLGLGVGFGLGEAAYLAFGISQTPQYVGLPWYVFTGYLYERTIVCFIHGVMTAVVVTGYQNGRLLKYYFVDIFIHSLVNIGAVLFSLGYISGPGALILLIASTLLCGVIFELLRRRSNAQTV